MGKSYKELKSKIHELTMLCVAKDVKNKRVLSELNISNARIVEQLNEIEELKEVCISLYKKRSALKKELEELQLKLVKQDGLPFVEDVQDALKEYKCFTSRFMPNVKFKVPKNLEGNTLSNGDGIFQVIFKQCVVDKKGVLLSSIIDDNFYYSLYVEEVSIYEAIPELVPDGMVYDKDSDSLKSIVDSEKEKLVNFSLTTCPYCNGYGFKEHNSFDVGMLHAPCPHCDGLRMVKKS